MSGVVVWITGLPSSGKSTLAEATRARLRERGVPTCVLDGDAVRHAVFPELGYGDRDRDAFYRGLAGLAAELARQDLVVLVPATANRRSYRDRARELAPRFLEVLVDASPEECARRDAKGLYAAERRGTASGVPGADAAYERPDAPDVVARGGEDEEAVRGIVDRAIAW